MDGYARLKMGKLYARAARYQKALEEYDKAIALTPGETGFYFFRGIAHFHLNNMPEALADFQVALEADPFNKADILNFTGYIRFHSGDADGARRDLADMFLSGRVEPNEYRVSGEALESLFRGQSKQAHRF